MLTDSRRQEILLQFIPKQRKKIDTKRSVTFKMDPVWKAINTPAVCASSHPSRIPDDSDSKSGVIRQRQNCLESQAVEGQDLPVLTLGPCTGTKAVPALNQVMSHVLYFTTQPL